MNAVLEDREVIIRANDDEINIGELRREDREGWERVRCETESERKEAERERLR